MSFPRRHSAVNRSSGSRRALTRNSAAVVFAVFALLGSLGEANGQTYTWSGGSTTNGNWSNTSNWVGGTPAGSTTGTTDMSTALFNSAIANGWGTPSTPIIIDSTSQNIGNISFGAAAGSYYIGQSTANPLLLTSGGTIQLLSNLVGNANETINAPMVIEGTNGTYTFANNSASGFLGVGSSIGGIEGGAAGATVLTLTGSNPNFNFIAANIFNGAATSLAIYVTGGLWTLAGSNTYTGGTTISAGGLYIYTGTAGSGLITLGDANTNTSSVTLYISNPSVNNAVTVSSLGSGTATISIVNDSGGYTDSLGALTFNRAATLNAPYLTGYLQLTSTISGSGDLTIGSTNGQRLILSGSAAGFTGNIVVANAAVFEPRSAFSGSVGNAITVNSGGILQIAFASASFDALNGAGTVQSSSLDGVTRTLTIGNANGSGTFSGTIQNGGGSLALAMTGTGTEVLSGTNTFTGGATISGGTLQFVNIVSMPSSGAVAVQTGATLAVNAGGSGQWTTGTSGNGTISGLLSGLGGQSGGTVSYAGNVTLGIDTTNGPATQTYAGNIVNVGTTLGLTKLGPNTLALGGANSYTGATIVNGGALAINGSQTAATGAITVASGALLQGAGASGAAAVTVNGAIQGGGAAPGTLVFSNANANLTINTGAAINVNVATLSSPSVSLLNLTGTSSVLNLNPSSGKFTINLTGDGSDSVGTYHFTIASVGSAGTISLNGTSLGIGGAVAPSYYTLEETSFTHNISQYSLMTDTTSGHNLILSVTVTPEPGHIMLICAGLLLFGYWIKNRKAHSLTKVAHGHEQPS